MSFRELIMNWMFRLVLRQRPLTVTRLVIAVIVDAVYPMLRGGFKAHISKKVFKLRPAFATTNPSPAIVLELAMLGIVAPLAHSIPAPIFRSLFALSVMAVLSSQLQGLSGATTATGGTAATQFMLRHDGLIAAIAGTVPSNTAMFTYVLGTRYDDQTTEPLSCEITGYMMTADKTPRLPFEDAVIQIATFCDRCWLATAAFA